MLPPSTSLLIWCSEASKLHPFPPKIIRPLHRGRGSEHLGLCPQVQLKILMLF